ncbi:MAG: rRNA cytosine-C5-methyltransferase, partial [Nocardioidaceae bacterium]
LLAGLAAGRGARVLACERLPHRARLVRQALRGGEGARGVVCADGTRPAWRPQSFDRVLADVPCTGMGALRRRPESRWRRGPDDVPQLTALQRSLLGSAVDSCRTGGVVAYVTCSPHPAETRGVVDAVLRERCDVVEEDARELLPDVPDVGPGPSVHLWPHRHGTDAMFLAALRRREPSG